MVRPSNGVCVLAWIFHFYHMTIHNDLEWRKSKLLASGSCDANSVHQVVDMVGFASSFVSIQLMIICVNIKNS